MGIVSAPAIQTTATTLQGHTFPALKRQGLRVTAFRGQLLEIAVAFKKHQKGLTPGISVITIDPDIVTNRMSITADFSAKIGFKGEQIIITATDTPQGIVSADG